METSIRAFKLVQPLKDRLLAAGLPVEQREELRTFFLGLPDPARRAMVSRKQQEVTPTLVSEIRLCKLLNELGVDETTAAKASVKYPLFLRLDFHPLYSYGEDELRSLARDRKPLQALLAMAERQAHWEHGRNAELLDALREFVKQHAGG